MRSAPGSRPALPVLAAVVLCADVAAGVVGNTAWPTLAVERPLYLVMLNSATRHVVMAAHALPAAGLFMVAVLRRMALDPIYFYAGRSGRFGRLQPHVDYARRRLRRRQRPMALALVLAPSPVMCALSGAGGMRPAVFVALNFVATSASVMAAMAFHSLFAGPVGGFLALTLRYRGLATVLSVLALVGVLLLTRRRWRRKEGAPE